jgi:uncharacterized protein YgbK (DUF1537 family)
MFGKLFGSKMPGPIVVIADDLSGAAELAGIAFGRGYKAEVQRQFNPASDAAVIAVDTDSRHLSPEAAASRAEQCARAAIAARPAWIYKKVDSVLRGNVRVEIEAVAQILQTPLAVLVPANPSRGRTIVGGRLLIDGVPLDQTAFRHDEHPRDTSVVADLLGQSDRIYAPDVGDEEFLAQLAQRTLATTLAAGAADYFTALLDARGAGQGEVRQTDAAVAIGRPALLVCGSPAAWQTRQKQCQQAGIPIVTASDLLVTRAVADLAGRGVLVVALDSRSQLPRLAAWVAALMEATPVATVLAEGGATAAAIAEQLGWTRFRVVQSAPAGVGVLQPLAPSGGPLFLIKPGSYTWPDGIWRQLVPA